MLRKVRLVLVAGLSLEKRPGNPESCWHGNIKMKAEAVDLVAGLKFLQKRPGA